jgi:hypothetical protein
MNESKSNKVDTIYGKEQLKVTCVERKYKIERSTATFIIVARTELDEDATGRLLHEDMELKTFLANYEITDIMLPTVKPSIKSIVDSIIIDDTIETGQVKLIKRGLSKNKNKKTMSTRDTTARRRALFDSLDLPEKFTSRDYVDAVEKNGMSITNDAMPYDDMKYFIKKGKVEKLEKTSSGARIYRLIKNDSKKDKNNENDSKYKNDENDSKNEIFI